MSLFIKAPSARICGLITLFTLVALALIARPPHGQALGSDVTERTPDGRVLIDSLPFTINECGSYVVSGCLTGVSGSNGIAILASDVTVDLNGNTLLGVDGTLAGISVSAGLENISISGGTLRGWRKGGVVAPEARLVRLRDLRSIDNNLVGLAVGEGSQVIQCVAERTRGIGIELGESSRVAQCSSLSNQRDGVVAAQGSLVSDSIASGNDGDGISAIGVIRTSIAENNSRDGIAVSHGALFESASFANGRHAMRADQQTLLRDCSASLSPTAEPISVAFALGSHCFLGESRMDVFSNQDGIRISGQRSAVERCAFSAWNTNASALSFIGSNNFIAESFYLGFNGLFSGPVGNNAYGTAAAVSPGFTNNDCKFGSVRLNY